jgi:hypothetical protein
MNIVTKLNHVNIKVMYVVTLYLGCGKGNMLFITISVSIHSAVCMFIMSEQQSYNLVLGFCHILKPVSHQKNFYDQHVVISVCTKLKIIILEWFSVE